MKILGIQSASFGIPRVAEIEINYVGGVKVKNSHILGAVAEAPGKVVTPNPSSMRRNRLSCWYVVVDL
jgi:hypothetical protein